MVLPDSIDKIWYEMHDITVHDAAFWMQMKSDPKTHEYQCDNDYEYVAYYSDHPNGQSLVLDKCNLILSAIRSGVIKATKEHFNGDYHDVNKTYILKSDWIKWCKNYGYPELSNLFSNPKNALVETNLTLEVPFDISQICDEKGVSYNFGTNDDWTMKARKIADRFFDNDTKLNTRNSLVRKNKKSGIVGGYALKVMEEMQRLKINGSRGLICNPATILRDALQGSKWWANKPK